MIPEATGAAARVLKTSAVPRAATRRRPGAASARPGAAPRAAPRGAGRRSATSAIVAWRKGGQGDRHVPVLRIE